MGQLEVFNHGAFFEAIEKRKLAEQLSWQGVAEAVWNQSRELNLLRPEDHPLSVSSIKKMGQMSSCQHSLFVLRWLEMPPEVFVNNPHPSTVGYDLPVADTSKRLRWNLKKLYANVEAVKTSRDISWTRLAHYLRCTPSQLTGLRTAKFTTSLELAMRISQMVHKPAAHFIYLADW